MHKYHPHQSLLINVIQVLRQCRLLLPVLSVSIPGPSSFITSSALCLLQTTLHCIVCQAEGALMESESINMEGSVEVTLAPN